MLRLRLIRGLFVTVTVAAVASDVHADVWSRAVSAESDRSREVYDAEMQSGDELVLQATASRIASRSMIQQLLQRAIASYRNAAKLRINEPEPYYRIARLEYSFYFECGQTALAPWISSPLCPGPGAPFDNKHAQEVIDAWNEFEARAPLDPRLSPVYEDASSADFSVLFHRAVLHTHFATQDHLVAAIADYEKILERSDAPNETTLANLAETYMMLGQLEHAVETYRRALRMSHSTETLYGLAVALDRSERGSQAKELIVSQGRQQMEEFHRRVSILHLTFFVPRGEEYYYFALASEAFGDTANAIDYWQKYLISNAHPEFQPRARSHLEVLLAKPKPAAPRVSPKRAAPVENP